MAVLITFNIHKIEDLALVDVSIIVILLTAFYNIKLFSKLKKIPLIYPCTSCELSGFTSALLEWHPSCTNWGGLANCTGYRTSAGSV